MQYASIRRDGGAILSQQITPKTSPKWQRIRQGCALLEQYRDLARLYGGLYREIHQVLMNPSTSWVENLTWAEHMAFGVCYECDEDARVFEQLYERLQAVIVAGQEASS